MTTTIENITSRLVESYTISLTEEETVNTLLDHINYKRREFSDFANNLEKLSDLIRELTWLADIKSSDQVIIKGLITMGKEADKNFRKYYSSQKKLYAQKGLLKEELSKWKSTIELHIETVLEVEHIIFDLRKRKDFKELSALLNDL